MSEPPVIEKASHYKGAKPSGFEITFYSQTHRTLLHRPQRPRRMRSIYISLYSRSSWSLRASALISSSEGRRALTLRFLSFRLRRLFSASNSFFVGMAYLQRDQT